ncbi:hypothetical protein [Paenibacillus sp. SN-8-1]
MTPLVISVLREEFGWIRDIHQPILIIEFMTDDILDAFGLFGLYRWELCH